MSVETIVSRLIDPNKTLCCECTVAQADRTVNQNAITIIDNDTM
jgi:hypothetical protein